MIYASKTAETVRVITNLRTVCDICKLTIAQSGGDRSEVTVKAELGNVWPEADCRTTARFDICPACWTSKVRPAIEALGAEACVYDTENGGLYPEDPGET
jgi:hypothetical protein